MEFRLLGPLGASEGDRQVPLGGPKQRAILAHLLLRANRLVSADHLIDEIWGEGAPEKVRVSLQSYVSHLRKALANGERIEGSSTGYVLHAEDHEVDAIRFEALVGRARSLLDDDPERAVAIIHDALGLWRGSALEDLADEPSLRGEIARLEELRMSALEDRIEAELGLGHHSRLVGELEALVERHPLRERLWGQLMLALYRSGRQAEALEAFHSLRRKLADELGIDPTAEIRQLHDRMLAQDPTLDAAARTLRGYRLLEQLGEGSFGVVYRAVQPKVGRDVAVKVIRSKLANDAGFIRRFEAEAQMVARLEHPHIVPLYDYWREPDAAYLVMRWLRSGSLRDALAGGPLNAGQVARLVGQVASALTAAHRRGIVHRDVKPANILLDEDQNAYLSDFGIAWDPASRAEMSPEDSDYLSPEQLRGEPPTPRTDVYSLGVVIHETLAGRRPTGKGAAVEPESLSKLPAAVTDVLRRATAADPGKRHADAGALAAELLPALGTAGRVQVRPRARNPYKGLHAFQEADADDFFGREALTSALVARVQEPRHRLLAVVGPSGVGKSSAVRAGLIPALRAGALEGSQDWLVVEMLPGKEPMRELATALLRIAVEGAPGLVEDLERDEHGLVQALPRLLPAGSEALLVIDQFEELFTLVDEEARRAHFIDSLVTAMTDPETPLRAVVTLRADFYDRPLAYRELGELIRMGTEIVLPLSPEELERAVARPAEKAGVGLEPRLVPEIVSDVADQPGALPQLQYTLTELFERRIDDTITLDSYRALGGVSGALVRRAEEIYAGLYDAGRKAVRQVFLRLVTLGEGTEDTRRRVPRSELISLERHGGDVEQVIDAFGRHRLLAFDRDPRTREPTVEVAHEALLRAWGRLQGWIDTARDDVRMHRRLASAAAEWVAAERDSSFLLRGARLAQLEAWSGVSELALARPEREYLEASIAAREQEAAERRAREIRERALERRSIRRLRALVAVLTLAALVAASLSVFALTQRRAAQDETLRAEREARVATARELAAAATANLEPDPELALLLGLEAVVATQTVDGTVMKEAAEALHSSIQATRVEYSVPGLFGIQFSPDGRWLATSNADGTARIWDGATGQELMVFEGHEARTLSVDFSSDGRLLATSSEDGTAKVWDAATGEELQTFIGHDAGLRSPHFSRDDEMLATTSFDGTTRLWDVATGRQLRVIEHTGGIEFGPRNRLVVSDHPVTVYELASGDALLTLDHISDPRDATWSHDGTRIAVSDGDGAGYVFDAETGEEIVTLSGHTSVVGEIVFSADDSMLVTTGADGTVRIWDADTGRERLVLRGLRGNIEGVWFNHDGTLVAGSSGSGIATVWDITPQGSRELLTIPAHDGIIFGMSFTPDGSRIVTGSIDRNATVWDAQSGEELLELEGVGGPGVAVGPDGTRIVTGGGVPGLWDADTGRELVSLEGHEDLVFGFAFSPDGKLVATASDDGTAKVWDAETGRELFTLEGHSGWVMGVAFSPDGTRLATTSQDETAKVWDVGTGKELMTMVRHQDNINAAVFSPDGRLLYTAGEDGVAKVWDVPTGRELGALSGHAAGLLDIAMSPDGSRLATGSRDGTVKLWDPSSGQELLSLAGHSSGVSAIAFSPDGRHLAAAAEDGSVRLLTLSIEELVQLAQDRVTRELTDDECRQYLHGERCPARS